ncbi:MAG: hypothetical protein ABH816_01725 [Candidatus Levyibacteriota bacterium]
MDTEEVSLAKIVANPTKNSWSQVYNAGNLFAVLSLSCNLTEVEENDTLNIAGKEIFDCLEKEYYTLEDKNLNSIKEAVSLAAQKIPEQFLASFVVAAIIKSEKTLLYAFSLGGAKAIIKREDNLGQILNSTNESKDIVSCSGFLENNDLVIFETKQFANIVSRHDLLKSLDHFSPSEIAESLSPKIHEKEEGGAAAIIISCLEKEEEQEDFILEKNGEEEKELNEQEEPSVENASLLAKPSISFLSNKFDLLKSKLPFRSSNFSHQKKVFLTVVLILLLILIISVFFAFKKKQDEKTQALFQGIFAEAQKNYDEGQSLLSLNKNLARDDLQKAQKILIDAKPKFSANSKEEKDISGLLTRVNEALSLASQEFSVEAKAIDEKQSLLLSFEKSNASITCLTQDAKNIYFVDDKGVNQVAKGGKDSKVIIKNNNSWQTPGELGVYLGNIYLLDKKANQILKFVANNFSKSNYLASSESVDFNSASSLTIDGSIYVLLSDGTIRKFTKGKSDSFTIKSLDKPLLKPSRIFTSSDANNIYILDNGNSRIVVLDKNGNYLSQYQSKIVADAKDFEVLESSKKIFLLSQNKIYQIELK